MATKKQLSDNDQDLLLARKFEHYLDKGGDLTDVDDPLLSDLLAYRRSTQAEEATIPADGLDVWNCIEKETAPVTVKLYKIASQTRVWATAAILLIAAFITVYHTYQDNKPVLLAYSGSEIEVVQLQDGSEVTLRPNSSIYQLKFNSANHQYKLEGEGYFSVAYVPGRTFTVESEQGRAEVLGTRFVMRDWGQVTQVFLEEGAVRFETTDRSQSVVLEPGQSSSITFSDGLLNPDLANINEFLDWTRNEMFFDSRPAYYVFNELEHHFQISIEAPEGIKSDILGGAISLKDRNQSLNDLGTVLNGRFVTDDDIKYTFIPN